MNLVPSGALGRPVAAADPHFALVVRVVPRRRRAHQNRHPERSADAVRLLVDMTAHLLPSASRRPRVGWTLSRRVQVFRDRKLLDLSLDEAAALRDALTRAIEHAQRLPDTSRPGTRRRA